MGGCCCRGRRYCEGPRVRREANSSPQLVGAGGSQAAGPGEWLAVGHHPGWQPGAAAVGHQPGWQTAPAVPRRNSTTRPRCWPAGGCRPTALTCSPRQPRPAWARGGTGPAGWRGGTRPRWSSRASCHCSPPRRRRKSFSPLSSSAHKQPTSCLPSSALLCTPSRSTTRPRSADEAALLAPRPHLALVLTPAGALRGPEAASSPTVTADSGCILTQAVS